VIQSITGEEVKDARDLAKKIAGIAPGQTTTLGVFSDGFGKDRRVDGGENAGPDGNGRRPSREHHGGAASLGLRLAPAAAIAGEGTRGVMVTGRRSRRASAERGVHAGDVHPRMSPERAVDNPLEVRDAVDQARSAGKTGGLDANQSGDAARYIAVPLAAG